MPQLSPDKAEKVLKRAYKRFKQFMDWEGEFRDRFVEDIRFEFGDPDNRWQWDATMLQHRDDDRRPSLTFNLTYIDCLLVINQIKKRPPSISVRPTGMGATTKSAEMASGLVREIGRASNAPAIYVKAAESLVPGGVGYWRVLTEFEEEMSFDQVIRIRSVRSAMGVALDPDAKEPSGADSKWGMIWEDRPNDEIEEELAKYKDQIGVANAVTGEGADNWINEDHTRVAEYYELETVADELVEFFSNKEGEPDRVTTQYLSKILPEFRADILGDNRTRKRPARRIKLVWYKIIGDKIVDFRDVPGKYVPIIRAVGQEAIIEGKLDRKGMVRPLKDTQRNLNYWVSSGAEALGLQTKSPWVGPAAAFENHPEWATANTQNHAYLSYNHKDDEDVAIPAPTRPNAPQYAQGFVTGIEIAQQQFKNISGQHENTHGQEDNADSGRAILARKESGDTATYNFPDALAAAVAHTGRVILEMIPAVYDTKRMIRITNEDKSQSDVTIDPNAEKAHSEIEKPDEENTTETIFNPNIGRYDVEAEAGPDYATQRQWAVDAFTQILSQNKELWTVIGDLAVENMDFPGATPMAERLRRIISPAILGEGPTQNEQQLQQQIEQGGKLVQSLIETLAEKQRLLDNKDEDITIKVEREITNRIKQLGNAQADFAAAGMEPLIQALMKQTGAEAMTMPDIAAIAQPNDQQRTPTQPANDGFHPSMIGARQAPDGHHYLPDDSRPGKYLRVEHA